MNEITTTRANALIDPSMHIWHLEIPLYLFLGGLVAGIMVLSGYFLLRYPNEKDRSTALSLLPWSAPVLLSLGMLFLWLDLDNRWNVFRFYFAFRLSSPMSWGSWILLAIYPISIATAWAATPIGNKEPRLRPLAIANLIAGAALGIYTGILLGTMAARPLWNSPVLGPLFLVSGISTGAAFLLLMGVSSKERSTLAKIDMYAIVVELLLIALWLIGLMAGATAARAAGWQLLGGPFTAAFWTMVVALGLLTPLFGEWLEHRHSLIPGRVMAALVLIGGFALRWIIVYAGQQS